MAYVLPIVGVIVTVVMKKGEMIAILLFAISAVLLFIMPSYISTTVTILGTVTEIDIDWVFVV